MMPEQLQQLVTAAQQGDRLALQRLLLSCYDSLQAYVDRRLPADLRRMIDADDVCQETLAVAARQLDTFRPGENGSFGHWLTAIADHRIVDLIRAARAQKRGGGRQEFEPDAASGERSSVVGLLELAAAHERSPSQCAVLREAIVKLQAALAQMDPDYRDAVSLRYLQGLSIEDAAARLGRTVGSVRMLCQRGLACLAALLGPVDQLLSSRG